MNETNKTFAFVGVAAAVLGLAFLARPGSPETSTESVVGQMLNPVEDPLSATRLKIVRYNESTGQSNEFEVAQVNNTWVIPSHSNYPADAQRQMSEAATCVMNLKILGVASLQAGDHEVFGVIDPSPENVATATTGVGMRVTMRDSKDDTLVNLIIGKEVKGESDLRYVREVGKDAVFIVELDPTKLSTNFSDWIEKDLLGLNPFDVVGLRMNDYSFDIRGGIDGPRFVMDPRSKIDVRYDQDATDDHWRLAAIEEFDHEAGEFRTVPLPEDETLDQTRLDELRDALADLQIVDVEPKPRGLSEDLKAEADFANNEQAVDLIDRGFYPMPVSEDAVEVYSSEGEVISQMKDGVEYVLRFGRRVLGESGDQIDAETGETADAAINRYLFVTARFNEDLIPRPAGERPPAEEEPAADEEPADQDPVEAPKTESPAESNPPATPTDSSAGSQSPEQEKGKTPSDPPDKAADSDTADNADTPSDEKGKDSTDNVPKNEATDTGTDSQTGEKPTADPAVPDAPPADIETLRRQWDQYDAAVAQGKKRAKELNERFGDWYYVISEEMYKKIHLGRKDILKPADGKTDGLDALDQIENGGLPAVPAEPQADEAPKANEAAPKAEAGPKADDAP